MTLRHGVATNDDLAVSAGVLRLTGSGNVDLGAGTLDYAVKASANPKVPELADLAGLHLPIQFFGSLASPEYKVDYASLKEQITEKQKMQKQQAEKQRADKLQAAEAKKAKTLRKPVARQKK